MIVSEGEDYEILKGPTPAMNATGDEQLYSESIIADVTTDVYELVQKTVNISDLVGKDLALLYSKGTTAAWKFNTKYYDNTGVNIAGNLASITDIVQRFNCMAKINGISCTIEAVFTDSLPPQIWKVIS